LDSQTEISLPEQYKGKRFKHWKAGDEVHTKTHGFFIGQLVHVLDTRTNEHIILYYDENGNWQGGVQGLRLKEEGWVN
jgi:hypothetical protein